MTVGSLIAALMAVLATGASEDDGVAPDSLEAARCAGTVSDLPASELYDASDRRLRGRKLLVVHKSARVLMLFERGRATGCWTIGLGFNPEGDKHIEGDGKTPEGWYRTSDKPWSTFDNAIAIHYPNVQDAQSALAEGTINRWAYRKIVDAQREGRVPPQRTAMGGAILIHGGGSTSDWTLGCVALDDDDLSDLRAALPTKRVNLLVLP